MNQTQQSNTDPWVECLRDYEQTRKPQFKQPKFQGYINKQDKESNYNILQHRHYDQQKDEKVNLKEKKKQQKEMNRSFNIPNKKKYYNNYDIVNLEKTNDFGKGFQEKTKKYVMPSRQVDYNIVTNNLIDQNLYKNTDAKFEVQKTDGRRKYSLKQRESNIISNVYKINHQEKINKQNQQESDMVFDRINKKQNFNCITATFYNQKKEDNFVQKRAQDQKNHGKDFDKQYPPSWKYREPFILDPKKLPPELEIVDKKAIQSKKRMELRFQLENEFRERDIQKQDVKNSAALIKYQNKDQKHMFFIINKRIERGKNIITNNDINKAETIQKFNIKQESSNWNKILVTAKI